MQPRNNSFFVFMLAAFGFMMLWLAFHNWMYPPLDRPEEKPPDVVSATGSIGLSAAFAQQVRSRASQVTRDAERQADRLAESPTPPHQLIPMGSEDPTSPFHLGVKLDPRGGGVRSVLLNKFPAQDEDGRPAPGVFHLLPEDVNGGKPLRNGGVPANLLTHFLYRGAANPSDELGRVVWTSDPKPTDETLDDGRLKQTLAFRTEILGIEIVKTFALTTGEYHLGLTLAFTRKSVPENLVGKRLPTFKYQLSGGRGLPIEGKWFTSTFRNSLIAQDDKGTIYRDFQDSRQIGVWGGGPEVVRDPARVLRYAGIAVQYFASVIVVDDQQTNQMFVQKARPTLETAVTRGTIKSIAPDRSSFVVTHAIRDYTFRVEPDNFDVNLILSLRKPDDRVAVTSYTERHGTTICEKLTPEFSTIALWEDDLTIRVTSVDLDLELDKTVEHKYLLYNGPVKPSLLGMMKGEASVPQAVVDRYVSTLQLNTLTDYQFPGWIGSFSNSIYWTHLVIKCTNLLHWILNVLYSFVPNYGVCILLLTVLVRGIMYPLSRKQAEMALKMQALGPELKLLQAKFGDDRQGFAVAQMALFRKHGVNPFGTCWVLLLQMPIFMGLWYALQESLFFRLAPFWPTWIVNLSAPDMFLDWGRGIPILSRNEDYGGFLYLGPYLNLMPIAAIALMVVQQKLMSPPATDEQMEANQRVMTIMMCVMGLLFYKVAAGLCIYFVASSVWGLVERAMLPKPNTKLEPATTPSAPGTPALATATTGSVPMTPARETVTQRPQADPRNRGKKARKGGRNPESRPSQAATPEESNEPAPTGFFGRIGAWWRKRRKAMSEWWEKILREAEKK